MLEKSASKSPVKSPIASKSKGGKRLKRVIEDDEDEEPKIVATAKTEQKKVESPIKGKSPQKNSKTEQKCAETDQAEQVEFPQKEVDVPLKDYDNLR